jgi:hypothetical protein
VHVIDCTDCGADGFMWSKVGGVVLSLNFERKESTLSFLEMLASFLPLAVFVASLAVE